MRFSTLLVLATSVASVAIDKRGAGDVITTCSVPGTFSLSFDDGPFTFGHGIASLLSNSNAGGSFFVNGYNYGCIYDYSDELIARYNAGFLIGSHTWNHRDITQISTDAFEQQLDLIETALWKILGIRTKYFRPPYGSYNDATLAILKRRGYQVVTWSFDSGDSQGFTTKQSITAYHQLVAQQPYPTPQMSLNHETYSSTSQFVPKIVPFLQSKGYKLVTIAECLGDDSPYQYIGKPGVRDSTWTCAGTPTPGA